MLLGQIMIEGGILFYSIVWLKYGHDLHYAFSVIVMLVSKAILSVTKS